ncbi:CDP-diglyceride synthase [Escherichia coli]|uniref:phosphatidate cytidylyltransferase n=2 Tax=Escherichia coli TaxID=562 RepID=UPI0002CA93AB|nr:phosphatidate cytidylyltransferase [Escherichia coli]ENE21092.1 cytidylyltransferase family protein [Escherichia coli P0304799.3]GCY03038.1 CDP-diglyceride synthase [Escherichia coli]HDV7651415.1 phosphatidate cytidylyltransferase [Escherichia coli]HEO1180764.1 phosphatidate cytidylyltransferase [Escherichia coli]
MSDSLRTMHYCLVGIFTLLVLATIILFILRKFRPQYDWFELQQRINSWWIIVGLFSLAMLSPKEVALAFWGFLSFLSLKEYLTLTPTRRSDSIPLLWMYVAIPLQYIWVGMSWYGMFIIFIPVYVFLFLPVRMVLVGDTRSFLHSASILQWGMMTTVFALSHVAFLMMLPGEDTSVGALLVIFLVATTGLNDIAQYLWGKTLGKIKVMPKVSPNKTLAGLLGGMLSTTLLATIFGPLLTPMNWLHALGAGVIIGLSGFCGDVVMSAVKRDLGVKDSGKLLPGHGGILDRLDSLIYTAPLFFHFYYYFYV